MGYLGGYFGSYFGAYFGAVGGSPSPTPDVASDAETCTLAQARLPQQFIKPKIRGLLCALATPAQEIHDNLLALLTSTIDQGVGIQLDVIGRIVGQPRNSLDDDTYRQYLRVKVAVTRSRGSTPEIVRIARLFLGDSGTAKIIFDNQGAAGFLVLVDAEIMDDAEREALLEFLQTAAAAGVRVIFENVTVTPAKTLTYATEAYLATSPSAGSSVIVVDSTDDFPSSGELKIDPGNISLGHEETLSYTSKTATEFNLATTLAFNHTSGDAVQLAGANAKGAPMGADAFLTTSPGSGSGVLVVDTTGAFPSSGTVQVDGGDVASGAEELLPYSTTDPTHFTLVGTTAHNHLAGDSVVDAVNGGAFLTDLALS